MGKSAISPTASRDGSAGHRSGGRAHSFPAVGVGRFGSACTGLVRLSAMPILLGFALMIPADCLAHPGLHEQEAAADKALSERPTDPDNYLIRGKLHQEAGHWDEAIESFRQALGLGADEGTVATLEGNTYLAAGLTLEAKARFEAALEISPKSPAARIGRARTLMLLDKPAEAEADFAIAFGVQGKAEPALVLERHSVLLAAGRPDLATRLLDEQIARNGLVPSLQIAAVDLDLEAGRDDDALRRVETLLMQSPGHPLWATRRAEILQEAGRTDQAHAAYREALGFVRARAARRGSPRLLALEKQLRAALASNVGAQAVQIQQGEQ